MYASANYSTLSLLSSTASSSPYQRPHPAPNALTHYSLSAASSPMYLQNPASASALSARPSSPQLTQQQQHHPDPLATDSYKSHPAYSALTPAYYPWNSAHLSWSSATCAAAAGGAAGGMVSGMTMHAPPPKPRLTTTVWEDEGTYCYQVDARSVAVTRREDNDMVNGTKLLNVVGMSRGKRDGILKNEKGRVVVKVGAMHLKGVWITLERARYLAHQYKIEDVIYPLLTDDPKPFVQISYPYVRATLGSAAAGGWPRAYLPSSGVAAQMPSINGCYSQPGATMPAAVSYPYSYAHAQPTHAYPSPMSASPASSAYTSPNHHHHHHPQQHHQDHELRSHLLDSHPQQQQQQQQQKQQNPTTKQPSQPQQPQPQQQQQQQHSKSHSKEMATPSCLMASTPVAQHNQPSVNTIPHCY
ncbi:uncharacterized protein VTP21DRAFT_5209 [Calcarisporiella thermophila]|uniref:uncharacterized protein n=1 Tax=Calcarisporiella thermophila TaxID=911321 RepID=UPI003744876D